MNAEQVIDKILSEAKQKAEALLEEARQKIAEQNARQQEQLNDFQAKSQTAAEQAGVDRKDRILAGARMDIRKQMLAAKVQMLDELFALAHKKITTMPDEDYRSLMMKLLLRTVQAGNEEVIVGKAETRINQDFIKKANSQLPGRGNLRLSDEWADIEGGFLLKMGKVKLNVSTEVLIEQVREELEPQLVQDLFAEE